MLEQQRDNGRPSADAAMQRMGTIYQVLGLRNRIKLVNAEILTRNFELNVIQSNCNRSLFQIVVAEFSYTSVSYSQGTLHPEDIALQQYGHSLAYETAAELQDGGPEINRIAERYLR